MVKAVNRERRVAALEQAHPTTMARWIRLRRYENESEEQAVAAYEAEHGPIGDANIVMRVIINKPGFRSLDGDRCHDQQ